MTQLDHTSPVPLHFQVEQILRQLIKEPAYQDGQLLPNEVHLANQWGIARNTLRQAITKLVQEGLLIRKKGVGTKVAGQHITTNLANWHSFTQEMNEQGVPFINLLIRTTWVEASDELSRFFGIAPLARVLSVERVKGTDNQPVVYFQSYFHPRIGLTGNEDFARPLYDILERDHQVVPSVSREQIEAIAAPEAIAEWLQIDTGSPVLLRRRQVLDAGGRPVEYNVGYYDGNRFTYSIDIDRRV
ncbi:MAG: GntR family transcriptional regulator [Bacteroidetes bacterium]|nr:GntR family transcriptional regulator [Fibrella sp.]